MTDTELYHHGIVRVIINDPESELYYLNGRCGYITSRPFMGLFHVVIRGTWHWFSKNELHPIYN